MIKPHIGKMHQGVLLWVENQAQDNSQQLTLLQLPVCSWAQLSCSLSTKTCHIYVEKKVHFCDAAFAPSLGVPQFGGTPDKFRQHPSWQSHSYHLGCSSSVDTAAAPNLTTVRVLAGVGPQMHTVCVWIPARKWHSTWQRQVFPYSCCVPTDRNINACMEIFWITCKSLCEQTRTSHGCIIKCEQGLSYLLPCQHWCDQDHIPPHPFPFLTRTPEGLYHTGGYAYCPLKIDLTKGELVGI